MNLRDLHERIGPLIPDHGDEPVIDDRGFELDDVYLPGPPGNDEEAVDQHGVQLEFVPATRCGTCGFLDGPAPNHHPDCPARPEATTRAPRYEGLHQHYEGRSRWP